MKLTNSAIILLCKIFEYFEMRQENILANHRECCVGNNMVFRVGPQKKNKWNPKPNWK